MTIIALVVARRNTNRGVHFRNRARSGFSIDVSFLFPCSAAIIRKISHALSSVKSILRKVAWFRRDASFSCFRNAFGNAASQAVYRKLSESYAKAVDAIAERQTILFLVLYYVVKRFPKRDRYVTHRLFLVSRMISWVLQNAYFICAGAEACRLREVLRTGSEEFDR